jgi:hypothetical protein
MEHIAKPINYDLITPDRGALDKYQRMPIMPPCLKTRAVDISA